MKMVEFEKIVPYLRGQNLLSPRAWRIRAFEALHKTPTIQLKYKLEVYQLNPEDKATFDSLNTLGRSEEANALLFTKGNLKATTGQKKSHSFVLQFLQHIEAMIAHAYGGAADSVTIKDTGGTNRSVTGSVYVSQYMAAEAVAAVTTYGILVGTGTTAPATADYAMQTLITNGIGGGQLAYNPTSVGGASIIGANVDLTIIRTYSNGSGGTITLKEIGLAFSTYYASAQGYFLVTHDAVNQAILNTEVAVVSYTMRTTV